ncbi:MAG: succinylglutamate desuccinylase/aspartoacylase family protein, partial [Deltaproteobacteria bacterium]|nr:succinylglutamate desuccinylase/aspartoacylase family protein [Deltaproteobacteria bacterium]
MDEYTQINGDVKNVDDLCIEDLPTGEKTRLSVELIHDGMGDSISIPVLVARGKRPGPVFGITAALHGNELNGIPVIHHLFNEIDANKLRGTVVAVVAVNILGVHLHQREFINGTDLNQVMPGREDGNIAEIYCHRVMDRIVRHFQYLVDLHTASFGRQNSLYVRADMEDPISARMAYLQRPQIIVHKPPSDGTLRGAAMDLGIPSITAEIGNPQRFQARYIRSPLAGLRNVLAETGILSRKPGKLG